MESPAMNEDPVKRFTLLLLFQAQQDHATELAIAPGGGERPAIRYKVGDAWHDLSPPPSHVPPGVVAELGRLASFTRRPFPKEGLIDVHYSGIRLLWVIRMASADAECILTPVEQ